MIILDFGSGNTCCNREATVENMIQALEKVDPDRKATIKWQLWDAGSEPQGLRLNWEVFEHAFRYAQNHGFRTTASVFDKPSLDYLLTFDVPFVKIANRPYLYHLGKYVPRGIPLVVSHSEGELPVKDFGGRVEWMVCVSEYPASIEKYGDHRPSLEWGISDHTIGLDLWRRYHPAVYEKHFKLPTSTGPDSGPWAATPDEISEVLNG